MGLKPKKVLIKGRNIKKTMNDLSIGVLSAIFVAIGGVFSVTGIKQYVQRNLYDTPVQAKITDMKQEFGVVGLEEDRLVNKAYITYECGGETYENIKFPNTDQNMKIGDSVDIIVQSKNPKKYGTGNIGRKGILCATLGLFFVAIGAFILIVDKCENKK